MRRNDQDFSLPFRFDSVLKMLSQPLVRCAILLMGPLLLSPVLAQGGQAAAIPEQAARAMAEIRASELLDYATHLASDELGGRLTGSPGQEAAANYIAGHFERLGLEPLGDEVDGTQSFYQRYRIRRTSVAGETTLSCGPLITTSGFAVLGGEAIDLEVAGKLRYLGRGRTRGRTAEVGPDDDLTDVIPVVLVRPPRGRLDRALAVEEKFALSFQSFASLGRTAKNLERRGARAVLFALVEDQLGFTDVLNYLALSPGKDLLTAGFDGASPGMGAMMPMLGGSSEAVSLVMTPALTARVFELLGLDRQAVLRYLAGEAPPPATDEQPDARLRVLVERDDRATACNVVAVLRGKDPTLRKQAVVFSAHMDHVGRRVDGEVFNGADDNASGSAGLMGIASAFARAEEKPERSVVFLSVSGEGVRPTSPTTRPGPTVRSSPTSTPT